MKKTILVVSCVAALSAFTTVGALAQTTGPAAQDTMKNNDTMSKDGMKKNGMKKDEMGTTGMTKDSMSKDGMKDKSQTKPMDVMKK